MKRSFMFFGKNHANKNFYIIFIFLLLLLNPSKVVAQTFNPSPPPSDNGFPAPGRYEFSSGMSIIFVLIVVVFFMMGCFSVYGRQCIESRGGSSRGLLMINEVNRRSRRAGHGLEPNVIDTFPTFLYSDVKKVKIGSISGLECAICLNEFKDEEILRMLPKCCHVFHPECIDTWLISHVTCPVCRADLVPVPGEMGTNSCNLLNLDSEDETTHRPTEEGGAQVHEVNEMAIEIDSVTNNQRQSFEGKFPRSHSTGHSLIQPSNNYERFTLRLPQDVQKKLMKPEFRRAKSNLVLPTENSAKKGFRSSSVGAGHQQNHNNYERFDHDGGQERWGFTMAPPFFTRSRSIPTPKGDDNSQMTSENSTKNTESPYDNGLFGGSSGKDEVGERSFVKLIGNSPV